MYSDVTNHPHLLGGIGGRQILRELLALSMQSMQDVVTQIGITLDTIDRKTKIASTSPVVGNTDEYSYST